MIETQKMDRQMMRRLLVSFLMSCVVVFCFASCGAGVKDQTPSVVINEILYNAPDELERLECIELHNVSSNEVDLTGWELDDEVKFKFPDKTVIAPGQFLVVAKDQELLDEFFDQTAVGESKKSLSNSG